MDQGHSHAAGAEGDDLPAHAAVLPEPRSPLWLPLLGAVLLGGVLVWWLSTPAESEKPKAESVAASVSGSGSRMAEVAPSPKPAPQPIPTPALNPAVKPAPSPGTMATKVLSAFPLVKAPMKPPAPPPK